MHALARLRVEDLNAVLAATRLVTGTADEAPVEAEAHAAHGAAVAARHGAPADPVCCVPEGDEGVAAADGEVAACWGEGDGETGGGVGVQGVEGFEGGVGDDFDGAVAGCCEEVAGGVWGVRGWDVV